jgi:hypothetical protein
VQGSLPLSEDTWLSHLGWLAIWEYPIATPAVPAMAQEIKRSFQWANAPDAPSPQPKRGLLQCNVAATALEPRRACLFAAHASGHIGIPSAGSLAPISCTRAPQTS